MRSCCSSATENAFDLSCCAPTVGERIVNQGHQRSGRRDLRVSLYFSHSKTVAVRGFERSASNFAVSAKHMAISSGLTAFEPKRIVL